MEALHDLFFRGHIALGPGQEAGNTDEAERSGEN
jgi:hypothetical protein